MNTITSFADNIYTGNFKTDEAEMDQSNLLKNWEELIEKSKPRTKEGKEILLKV